MHLIIREARPEDAEAVTAIFNPIIEDGRYTVFDAPFSVEAERAYLEALPQRGIFLLAVDAASDRVVGFQSMEPFAAYTGVFDHVGVPGRTSRSSSAGDALRGRCFLGPSSRRAARATKRSSRSSARITQGRWQPIPLTASPS